MYWGERVTQKTDFLPVTIESNAIVRAYACNGHVIMDGFEIKPGADVHIAPICNTCHPPGGRAENTSTDANTTSDLNSTNNDRIEAQRMIIYPNPTQHQLSIVLENENQNEHFDFFIYNFSGTLVCSGSSDERTKIELNLASGIYLVKVKTEELWYTEKLSIK